MTTAGHGSAEGRLEVRAVVLVAFEPDAGPVPGELTLLVERLGLTRQVDLPPGYRALRWNAETGVLGLIAGVGAARAAASVMALGLDPRYDLSRAFWVVSGVAGANPERAMLGGVVLPEWIVDGDLTHELDARQIPADWPDGFVPIGKSVPYENPRDARFNQDDGVVFRLDGTLIEWALDRLSCVELLDTDQMRQRRIRFDGAAAHLSPRTVRGDELASTTFFHGRLLGERAARWVRYQTDGLGDYAITAMEDAGILTALRALGAAGLVDWRRVLIARGISNFDRERHGISPAESLVESRVASYSAYRPALENAARVAQALVEELLAGSM
jgi:purine nucleoside permease